MVISLYYQGNHWWKKRIKQFVFRFCEGCTTCIENALGFDTVRKKYRSNVREYWITCEEVSCQRVILRENPWEESTPPKKKQCQFAHSSTMSLSPSLAHSTKLEAHCLSTGFDQFIHMRRRWDDSVQYFHTSRNTVVSSQCRRRKYMSWMTPKRRPHSSVYWTDVAVNARNTQSHSNNFCLQRENFGILYKWNS